jgi:penicillin-binding protein 2
MQNRAIQNSHSPGSVFKLIMADAGLEEGLFNRDLTVTCRGSAIFYGRSFGCGSKEGHGPLKLEQALAKSCNIFFYELGRRLGIEKIAEHAHAFGIGEKTGIDLPGEQSGLMPSPEWKRQARGERWYPGETISVAIGQGAVSTTPLQILRAVSAIATAGLLTTPHVLLDVEDGSRNKTEWPILQIPMSDESVRRIREGMWQSVNNWGTGHNAAVPGQDVCGKTGTAQVVGNESKQQTGKELEDHSWFVGFGNKDNPEIAVVVFIEHGGKGGVTAAPMAQKIFSAYFRKNDPEMLTDSGDSTQQEAEASVHTDALSTMVQDD